MCFLLAGVSGGGEGGSGWGEGVFNWFLYADNTSERKSSNLDVNLTLIRLQF